jgi:hypothetical protein
MKSLAFGIIGRLFPLSQRERAGVRENCSDRPPLSVRDEVKVTPA